VEWWDGVSILVQSSVEVDFVLRHYGCFALDVPFLSVLLGLLSFV